LDRSEGLFLVIASVHPRMQIDSTEFSVWAKIKNVLGDNLVNHYFFQWELLCTTLLAASCYGNKRVELLFWDTKKPTFLFQF